MFTQPKHVEDYLSEGYNGPSHYLIFEEKSNKRPRRDVVYDEGFLDLLFVNLKLIPHDSAFDSSFGLYNISSAKALDSNMDASKSMLGSVDHYYQRRYVLELKMSLQSIEQIIQTPSIWDNPTRVNIEKVERTKKAIKSAIIGFHVDVKNKNDTWLRYETIDSFKKTSACVIS